MKVWIKVLKLINNSDTKPTKAKATAKVAPEPKPEGDQDNNAIDAIENIFVVDQPCIMRVNDSSRIRFDLFVMLLATWNCYAIPFEIAFEPPFADSIIWT